MPLAVYGAIKISSNWPVLVLAAAGVANYCVLLLRVMIDYEPWCPGYSWLESLIYIFTWLGLLLMAILSFKHMRERCIALVVSLLFVIVAVVFKILFYAGFSIERILEFTPRLLLDNALYLALPISLFIALKNEGKSMGQIAIAATIYLGSLIICC